MLVYKYYHNRVYHHNSIYYNNSIDNNIDIVEMEIL